MFFTKRLMLRAIEPEVDSKVLTQWMNDIEYLEAIHPTPPKTMTKDGVKHFLESLSKQDIPMMVVCERPKDEDHPSTLEPHDDYYVKDGTARYPWIGLFNIGEARPAPRAVRFGIAMDRAHQNSGYGTEVLEWALEYCFVTQGLHRVELATYATNERAIHVYEKKLGFRREGVQKERLWIKGKWVDEIIFGMLESEYATRQK